MAYNELAGYRLRAALIERPGVIEKKMFGGVCYLLDGNMACGLVGSSLIIRVGPRRHAEALARPFARPFDFSGKPMAGWVYVDPGGYESDEEFKNWLQLGVDFAASLPKK